MVRVRRAPYDDDFENHKNPNPNSLTQNIDRQTYGKPSNSMAKPIIEKRSFQSNFSACGLLSDNPSPVEADEEVRIRVWVPGFGIRLDRVSIWEGNYSWAFNGPIIFRSENFIIENSFISVQNNL